MDVLPLGLTGDGALRAAVAADREVTRMEGVRLDHLAQYLGEASDDWQAPRPRPGVEQAVRLGGPGTPLVPEFAVCEIASALGLTQPAATALCADVLDLAYRLRDIATAVRCGQLAFARARVIARRTRDLPLEQAALVQERLCSLRDTGAGPVPMAALVPMSRLKSVTDQAVLTVRGPESAAEAEQRVAESLWVQVSPAEPGAADVTGRLAAADAVRLDRRLDQISGWLQQVGDDRPKPIRRAVALGLLADPDLLRALDELRRQRTTETDSMSHAEIGTSSTGHRTPQPEASDQIPGASLTSGGTKHADEPRAPASQRLASPRDTRGKPPADQESPPEPQNERTLPDPPQPDPPQLSGKPEPLFGADQRNGDGTAALGEAHLLDSVPDDDDVGDHTHDRDDTVDDNDTHDDRLDGRDVQCLPAGIAGCPGEVLERFAGMSSTVLYLHLDQASDTWCEERGGPLTTQQARALVGHSKVSVRPVLDLAEPLSYTGYVAPPRLKEQLALLNAGYCPFPYCHRRARAGDVDHQIPAAFGGPTASCNTHLPCRKHHRAKDKGGWKVAYPSPGVWIWTSPAGACYLVTNGTTTRLNGIATRNATVTARPVAAETAGSELIDAQPGELARKGAEQAGVGLTGTRPADATRVDTEADTDAAATVSGEPSQPVTGTDRPPRELRSDVPTSVKEPWTPPWDPWGSEPDPLTRDEHDVTYGLLNTA